MAAWLRRIRRAARSGQAITPLPVPAAASAAAPAGGSSRREDIRWRPMNLGQARRALFSLVEYSADRKWAREAEHVGAALLAARHYDVIISCGPPHLVHITAQRLSARFRIPYVMDLRDPWSLQERYPERVASPLWLQLAARAERRSVEKATLVTMNTELASQAMRLRYPALADRFLTVMNGADGEPIPTVARARRFTVAYAGVIYLDRSPQSLFQAAARLIADYKLTPEEFALQFIGNVQALDGRPMATIAHDAGLAGHLELLDPRPHDKLLPLLASAAMLVSLPQDSAMAIPSKIFEYVGFPAWLLVLTGRETATHDLLRSTDADLVEPHDVDGIYASLARRLGQFRAGLVPTPIGVDSRFSRRTQGGRLFAALESRLPPLAPPRQRDAAEAAG